MSTRNLLTTAILPALLLLAALATPAAAQTAVDVADSGAQLRSMINDPLGPGTIRLEPDGAAGGFFDTNATLAITRSLTIVGTGDIPEDVTIIATSPSAADNATILVEEGITLTLVNVTVQSGGTNNPAGIRVLGGGILSARRINFNTAGPGLLTAPNDNQESTVTVASSIFETEGVRATAPGRVVVMQCTFAGGSPAVSSTADADIDVVASLFMGGGNAFSNSTPRIQSWANYFDGGSIGGGEEVIAAPPLPPVYAGAGFTGKLAVPLEAGIAFEDLDADIRALLPRSAWFTDYERDIRSDLLQISADQVGGAVGIGAWVSALTTVREIPYPYVNGLDAAIYVEVVGIDLTGPDAGVFIRPQLDAGVLFPTEPLQILADGVYRAQINLGLAPANTVIDGQATIVLRDVNGVLYDTQPQPLVPPIEERQFIIDTIAPRLVTLSNSVGTEIVFTSSSAAEQATGAPGSSAFPGDWAPGFAGLIPHNALQATNPDTGATSINGQLNPTESPIYAFSNSTGDLGVAFTVDYVDDPPLDVSETPLDAVQRSGFAGALAEAGTVPDPDWGLPFIQETGTPGQTTITATFVVGTFGTSPSVEATWNIAALSGFYAPNWTRQYNFYATDRAGNVMVSTFNPVHLVWRREAIGGITVSAPETSSPRFGLTLLDNLSVPKEETWPAYPIWRVRVWRAVNAQLSDWEAVSPWTDWLRFGAISRATRLFGAAGTLGDYLDLPANRGATFAMTVVAGDHAGNIQSPGGLETATTATSADLSVVNHVRWVNPGELPNVETQLQANFWHNDVGLGNLRVYEQNSAERNFGQSARIPLPDIEDCRLRVEAAFDIQYQMPILPATVSGLEIFAQFTLSEDGRIAAAGEIRNDALENVQSLVIPTDILQPQTGPLDGIIRFYDIGPEPAAFLNFPPDDCGGGRDRLGDEGNPNESNPPRGFRYRDVTYQFTVAVGYRYRDANDVEVEIIDPTPATSTFTVYVDNRVGGDQPIKAFGAE